MNVSNAGADANTTTNTNKIIVATIVDTNANINDEHAVTDVGTNAIADASTIGVLLERDIAYICTTIRQR